MPIIIPASDGSGAYEQLTSQAGMGQVLYPTNPFPIPLPTTLTASQVWSSGLIFSEGYRYVTFGVTSTQTGSSVLTTYLDLAGTIARPATTTAIVANTALIVDLADLKPFVTLTLSLSNTSGSTATLSGFQLILAAG